MDDFTTVFLNLNEHIHYLFCIGSIHPSMFCWLKPPVSYRDPQTERDTESVVVVVLSFCVVVLCLLVVVVSLFVVVLNLFLFILNLLFASFCGGLESLSGCFESLCGGHKSVVVSSSQSPGPVPHW